MLDAVKERLGFHAPGLTFTEAADERTEPGPSAKEGVQEAVDVVRRLVGSATGRVR
jgi:hypothetical protein